MSKIQFDIKFRPQIESGEYKVVNRIGEEVRIICWDWPDEDCPIVAFDGDRMPSTWGKDGRFMSWRESDSDLFIVTPEPELTEFEKAFDNLAESYHSDKNPDDVACCKEYAAELLDLARKQLQPEIDTMLEDAYKTADEVQYRKGREEALKDLPRWKKCGEYTLRTYGEEHFEYRGDGHYLVMKGQEILLSDLEKLPGFKEDE